MGDVSGIDKEALRSAHTSASELRGEVLSGPERRRRWSTEEKLRVLAQSMESWLELFGQFDRNVKWIVRRLPSRYASSRLSKYARSGVCPPCLECGLLPL